MSLCKWVVYPFKSFYVKRPKSSSKFIIRVCPTAGNGWLGWPNGNYGVHHTDQGGRVFPYDVLLRLRCRKFHLSFLLGRSFKCFFCLNTKLKKLVFSHFKIQTQMYDLFFLRICIGIPQTCNPYIIQEIFYYSNFT